MIFCSCKMLAPSCKLLPLMILLLQGANSISIKDSNVNLANLPMQTTANQLLTNFWHSSSCVKVWLKDRTVFFPLSVHLHAAFPEQCTSSQLSKQEQSVNQNVQPQKVTTPEHLQNRLSIWWLTCSTHLKRQINLMTKKSTPLCF